MIVYRLAKSEYADALYSSGASNRWNKFKQQVIYTSDSISLCALELLAHTNGIRPVGRFSVMHIEIDDSATQHQIYLDQLPKTWYTLSSYSYTQQVGSEWYESKKSLLMKIPSAIIQSECNVVINTAHPGFQDNVRLKNTEEFFWDKRFPSSS